MSETGAHRARVWAIILGFSGFAFQNGRLVHISNSSVREF